MDRATAHRSRSRTEIMPVAGRNGPDRHHPNLPLMVSNAGAAPRMLALQSRIGNRALACAVVQRLATFNEINPPLRRIAPKDALLKYVRYLKRRTEDGQADPDEGPKILDALAAIRQKIGATTRWTAHDISELRTRLDSTADWLRSVTTVEDEEDPHAEPAGPDSDITKEYAPLKACVIQALQKAGLLNKSARDYHDELWYKDDQLRHYDMSEHVGPLYKRFDLTEVASGLKYKELTQSLKPGWYIMNVESPAGPNGHMFAVKIVTREGKRHQDGVPHQDPANKQHWADSDKIARYWAVPKGDGDEP